MALYRFFSIQTPSYEYATVSRRDVEDEGWLGQRRAIWRGIGTRVRKVRSPAFRRLGVIATNRLKAELRTSRLVSSHHA